MEDVRWEAVTGFEDLIPRLVAATLRAIQLSPETHSISIALLTDSEVRALNKAFRGKDSATNVLSFPAVPAPRNQSAGLFLGDIALAYETVNAEANEQDKPVLHHAAHLIVHGVLHLAGYDHASDLDAETMESTERTILNEFGIPDPYADGVPLSSTH